MAICNHKVTFAGALICAALLLNFASQAQALSLPIPLTGWTADVIAEKTATSPLSGTDHDDLGVGEASFAWDEAGGDLDLSNSILTEKPKCSQLLGSQS